LNKHQNDRNQNNNDKYNNIVSKYENSEINPFFNIDNYLSNRCNINNSKNNIIDLSPNKNNIYQDFDIQFKNIVKSENNKINKNEDINNINNINQDCKITNRENINTNNGKHNALINFHEEGIRDNNINEENLSNKGKCKFKFSIRINNNLFLNKSKIFILIFSL